MSRSKKKKKKGGPVAEHYGTFGRRALRTILRERDEDLTREASQALEDAIRRAATLWKHETLLRPAFFAASAAEALASDALAAAMRTFEGQDHPTRPAHRVTTLALMLLAAPLDLDGGVVLPGHDRYDLYLAMVAHVVRELGFPIGEIDKKEADRIWQEVEIDPALWDARVKRLAAAYEKDKYG